MFLMQFSSSDSGATQKKVFQLNYQKLRSYCRQVLTKFLVKTVFIIPPQKKKKKIAELWHQ